MSIFPIHIHEEGKPIPDDPICYIIAKEGIFMKKNLGIMDSIAKVDNISILQSIQTSAKMNIPKLPISAVAKTFAFFREVYKVHSAEAVVIIFYNAEKKSYKIIPPLQKVSGGGLSYDRDVTCEGYDKIGSIHSHANFSAFHSGVDDDDEWSFDGLHVTFGHNGSTDGTHTITASICSNKQRFVVNPEDYLQGIKLASEVEKKEEPAKTSGTTYYRWEMGKLVPYDPYHSKNGHYAYTPPASTYEKRYMLLATPKQMTFPKDIWMKLVEKQGYTYPVYRSGVYGGMGGNWWGDGGEWDGFGYPRNPVFNRSIDVKDRYSRHTDPDAWKNNRHVVVKNGRVCIVPGGTPKVPPPPTLQQYPQNVGVKVTPIEFPPHDQEDFNPCAACMFREEKIDWAIQMYTEEVEDDKYDPETAKDNFILHPAIQNAENEGMPLVVQNNPTAEMFYCDVCKRGFWMDSKDKTECPICQSPVINCKSYNKETEIHNQASSDSGALLIPDGDKFEKATLIAAAKEADRETFLIPEPGSGSIPINGKPPIQPRFSIRKLLQICKGQKTSGKL